MREQGKEEERGWRKGGGGEGPLQRGACSYGGGGKAGAQGRSVKGRPGAHQAMQRQGLSRQKSPCRCTRGMGQGRGGGYSVAVTIQTLDRWQCYLPV